MVMMYMGHSVQLAVCNDRLTVYCIRAGAVQSHRIKGSKHSHIRNDRDIVFCMAVAVGRHVNDQADMEMRPVF